MSETCKHKIQAEASMKRLLESVAKDAIEYERNRIVELLESRLLMAKNEAFGLTAMRISVDRNSAIAVTEALIYAIKEEQK